MGEVRYLCLSDLHLGEEDSVLSNMNEDGTEGDPAQPGPLLEQLALCVKDLAGKLWTKKPILVLNGDALELALCPLHRASMAFQCFINQFKDGDSFLFEKILFVPGNHDHHLWVMTREDQYKDYLQRKKKDPSVVTLPEQWHSTKLFSELDNKSVICHYLTDLIQRPPVKLDLKVQVAYPNLGIIREKKLNSEQTPEKCVVFHHGHFTEWIYNAMSTVNDWIFSPNGNPARHVWQIEKENFAWIDFAWSALGQSWDSPQGLESVYEKASDNRKFGEVLANLSSGLAKEIGTQSFDWVEGTMIEKFLKLIYVSFSGSEKGRTGATLSPDGLKQLFQYCEGPLHAQICYDILALQQGKNELDETVYNADFFKDTLVPPTTLILGHTHKPFASHEGFHGYSGGVDLYNAGGWVVESLDYAPLHGGSIILVDDQLNVAGIRMFNENADGRPLPVRSEPRASEFLNNPLADDIDKLNFSGSDPWKTFSQMVASIIRIRRKYLRQRVFSTLPKS